MRKSFVKISITKISKGNSIHTFYFVEALSWETSQALSESVQVLFLLSLSPHSVPPVLITLIWIAPYWLPLLLWFLMCAGLFPLPSVYPPTLYLYSKDSQGFLANVPMVLFKHLPHPVPGSLDVEKDWFKSTVCLQWNMYVNVWRSCMWLHVFTVCLCMSAHGSVSGSLLVCRVDSLWTHRHRLYLTLNDPPERVMRERDEEGENEEREWSEWRRGRTEAARDKDEIGWTRTKNKRTWEEKKKEAWDWLSGQNQHQALDLSTYWWNPFRLFLTGKRLKPNPGREQEGEIENIRKTMFLFMKSNDKHIFCFPLHINTHHVVHSFISTLGCVALCLEQFCNNVWVITVAKIQEKQFTALK